jgi:hypothetical protein
MVKKLMLALCDKKGRERRLAPLQSALAPMHSHGLQSLAFWESKGGQKEGRERRGVVVFFVIATVKKTTYRSVVACSLLTIAGVRKGEREEAHYYNCMFHRGSHEEERKKEESLSLHYLRKRVC